MRKILVLVTAVLLTVVSAVAQTRTITGRVTDEKGTGVDGASVQVKGTTTGTTADAQGNFRLNAKTGDVLVVSAVGFTSFEQKVGTGNTVSVAIAHSSASLSEVVVTTA